MKITIDNTLKTIEIDQDINFKELFDFIATTIKNWEEYKILGTKVIYTSPQIIPWYPDITPVNPYNPPWTVTCTI